MRNSARKLQREWQVLVQHGLYHHEGEWYHLLTRFPAALFDANGYVVFGTKEVYDAHPKLSHGAHLHVEGGISSISNYVRMTGNEAGPLTTEASVDGDFVSADGRTESAQVLWFVVLPPNE